MVAAYDYHYIFKLIVVGEMGTGKSALLQRFLGKEFQEKMNHTIGVEFGAKVIPIGEEYVKLQIWDTAGQERFRSVTQSYYRGTSGAILAYDITNRQSFSRLEAWLQDVRKLTHPQSTIMLVGTKCDGDDDGLRQVSYEEGHQFAHERELLFLETSAKSGIHVNACFEQLAHTIYCRAQEGTLDLNRVDSGVQRKGPYLYQQSTPVLGQRGTAYPRHSGQLEPADPPGDGAIWGSGRCSC